MKLIPNVGNERVIDELQGCLRDHARLDLATSAFSLFAYAEVRELLERVDACRVVLKEANIDSWNCATPIVNLAGTIVGIFGIPSTRTTTARFL